MLKIRLMSARRTLWANEFSLIHIESAALQMRKICEALAYICVLSADIEFDATHGQNSDFQVGKTFVRLERQNKLLFPRKARLEPSEESDSNTKWSLKIEENTDSRRNRVREIHNRCGNILHEFQPDFPFPDSGKIDSWLLHQLNGVRSDHQWLWNEFWQHANFLKNQLFFVSLGDNADANDRPMLISVEGFLEQHPILDFDPNFLPDFTGRVDWSEFSELVN